MSLLKTILDQSGKTMSALAREIGVPLQDLSHFIRRETEKVGRSKRKKIRAWMVQQGYMKPHRKREVCICPKCHSRHVMRKNTSREQTPLSLDSETKQ